MADIDIILDGVPQRIPQWALEDTQQQVLDQLRKTNTMQKDKLDKLVSGIQELTDEIIDLGGDIEKLAQRAGSRPGGGRTADTDAITEDLEDTVSDIIGTLDNLASANIDFGSMLGNAGETVGTALGMAAGVAFDFASTVSRAGLNLALGTVSAAVYTAAAALGFLTAAVLNVVDNAFEFAKTMNNLTSVGLGFRDVLGSSTQEFYQTLTGLSQLTGGFISAANMLANSAPMVIAQGVENFSNSMQRAADASDDLGFSIETSMERFGRALSVRQLLLNLGNLDQIKLNQQIENSVRIQQAYSRALGVSSEALQEFANNLIADNGMLSASLLRFTDTVRSDVIAGIESFAVTMRSMGGAAGGDIAQAFVEAASLGAMGFSETAMGFVAVLPRLSDQLTDFIGQVQTAGITQQSAQEITQGLANELGNLTQTERQRIFMLARSGDQYAQTMARAVIQFEQSSARIDDINQQLGTGLDIFQVQKGTNRLTKLINSITGAFSSTFYSLFANDGFFEGFSEALETITPQVQALATQMGSAVLNLLQSESVKTAFSRINQFLMGSANSFSDFVDRFITENGNINWTGMWTGIFETINASIPEDWKTYLSGLFQSVQDLGNRINNILDMPDQAIVNKIVGIFELLFDEIATALNEAFGKTMVQTKYAAGGALAAGASAATIAAIVSGPLAPITVPVAGLAGVVGGAMYGYDAGGQVYDRTVTPGLAEQKGSEQKVQVQLTPALPDQPTFIFQREDQPEPATQPTVTQQEPAATQPTGAINNRDQKLMDTLEMLMRTSDEQNRLNRELIKAVRDLQENM